MLAVYLPRPTARTEGRACQALPTQGAGKLPLFAAAGPILRLHYINFAMGAAKNCHLSCEPRTVNVICHAAVELTFLQHA